MSVDIVCCALFVVRCVVNVVCRLLVIVVCCVLRVVFFLFGLCTAFCGV